MFLPLILLLLVCAPLKAQNTKQSSTLAIDTAFFNQNIDSQTKYKTYNLSLKNQLKHRASSFDYQHDLGLVFLGSTELNTFDGLVSEAFLQKKIKNHVIAFGRKKQMLSWVDEEWDLGLTQSLFLHDPLNPIKQGQFGLHYSYSKKNYFIKAFASGIHLPNQGADFKNKNEQIQTGNPWFNKPPERIKEANGFTEVRYNVNTPDYDEMVLQPSASLQLGYSSPSLWWNVAYMNQASHHFNRSYLFSEETDTEQLFVTIEANTVRQQLYALNMGGSINEVKLWASVLKDKPDSEYKKSQSWVETHLNEEDWFSMGIKKDNFVFTHLSASTSYVRRLSKENKKITTLEFDELSSITGRSYFERSNSLNFKLKYKHRLNRRSIVELSQRYEYSLEHESELVSAKVNYKKDNLSLFSEFGILSAQDDDIDSFQAKYKGNDFIKIGFGYVF